MNGRRSCFYRNVFIEMFLFICCLVLFLPTKVQADNSHITTVTARVVAPDSVPDNPPDGSPDAIPPSDTPGGIKTGDQTLPAALLLLAGASGSIALRIVWGRRKRGIAE